MNSFPLTACTIILGAAASAITPVAGYADAIATFDDGNGVGSVDAYPGIDGDGWETAWTTQTTNNASFTTGPTVIDTDPLTIGGGNYLSASAAPNEPGSGSAIAIVHRRYASEGAVDRAAPHTVSFDFRPDEGTPTSWFFYDRGSPRTGLDGSIRWAIIGGGSGYWSVFDGDNNGNGSPVGTDVPIELGVTYSFTINLNPAERTYTVAIEDSEGRSYASEALGFRTDATAAGRYIHLGGRDDNAPFSFSVDNVTVVPEPSMLGLVLTGVAVALFGRRSRAY